MTKHLEAVMLGFDRDVTVPSIARCITHMMIEDSTTDGVADQMEINMYYQSFLRMLEHTLNVEVQVMQRDGDIKGVRYVGED